MSQCKKRTANGLKALKSQMRPSSEKFPLLENKKWWWSLSRLEGSKSCYCWCSADSSRKGVERSKHALDYWSLSTGFKANYVVLSSGSHLFVRPQYVKASLFPKSTMKKLYQPEGKESWCCHVTHSIKGGLCFSVWKEKLYNEASARLSLQPWPTVTDQHHPSCGLEHLDLSSVHHRANTHTHTEGHLDSAVSLTRVFEQWKNLHAPQKGQQEVWTATLPPLR